MNTPPTPKRWSNNRGWNPSPDGTYNGGLYKVEFSTALGEIISYWTILEEKMIEIMRALLGGKPDLPARQIFRAVSGNAARIRVLKTLLEKAPINKEKTAIYDEIINEFGAINSIRNQFAHGLWYTHQSGSIWIAEPTPDEAHFMDKREVKIEEFNETIERKSNLWYKIVNLLRSEFATNRAEDYSGGRT